MHSGVSTRKKLTKCTKHTCTFCHITDTSLHFRPNPLPLTQKVATSAEFFCTSGDATCAVCAGQKVATSAESSDPAKLEATDFTTKCLQDKTAELMSVWLVKLSAGFAWNASASVLHQNFVFGIVLSKIFCGFCSFHVFQLPPVPSKRLLPPVGHIFRDGRI